MIILPTLKPGLLYYKKLPNPLIPIMTSDTSPSGVAFSPDEFLSPAWYAFDNDIGTYWRTISLPQYIQYKFNSAVIANLYQFDAPPSGTGPSTWTLQGSNNGSSFTILDSQTNTNYSLIHFSNSTPYLYYRLNVTVAGIASQVSLSRLQLYN
jgi:hypothetical protein